VSTRRSHIFIVSMALFTVRNQLLQRVHGAHRVRTQRAYSILTAIILLRSNTLCKHQAAAVSLCMFKINRSNGSVVRAFAPWAEGRGFDPRPRHTKDVIQMVPDASLLGAQHIRTGLASLSSQTSLKKRWIPSRMSGREWLMQVGITGFAIDFK